MITKFKSVDPILNQMKAVHKFLPCLFKTHSNSILRWFSKRTLPLQVCRTKSCMDVLINSVLLVKSTNYELFNTNNYCFELCYMTTFFRPLYLLNYVTTLRCYFIYKIINNPATISPDSSL